MSRILIVEDDRQFGGLLRKQLERRGHTAVWAQRLDDGLAEGGESEFDLVLLDVGLPDGSGLKAVPRFRSVTGSPEVIILTGEGSPDGAETAIRTGAWDYIQKGCPIAEIVLPVENALAYRAQRQGCDRTRSLDPGPIVGDSPAMRDCFDQLAQAASGDANVLVTGETGTGKELFARAIHDNSARARGPFVIVDCAALPDNLVEATLFGHARGAFTGAEGDRDGLALQADGGTLFLDEVGELPLGVQKAFLRVLQEHRFRPVGGRKEVTSDFRLVAATNRDLDEMVRDGRFREDLLYRLRALELVLPPLRDRSGDVRRLVTTLLSQRCAGNGAETKGVSSAFLDVMERYPWPGNVREFIQALDRAIVAAWGQETLYPAHLPANIRAHVARQRVERGARLRLVAEAAAADDSAELPTYKEVRDAAGAAYLRTLMAQVEGDIDRACRTSGLSRSRLYDLLRTHDIDRTGSTQDSSAA